MKQHTHSNYNSFHRVFLVFFPELPTLFTPLREEPGAYKWLVGTRPLGRTPIGETSCPVDVKVEVWAMMASFRDHVLFCWVCDFMTRPCSWWRKSDPLHAVLTLRQHCHLEVKDQTKFSGIHCALVSRYRISGILRQKTLPKGSWSHGRQTSLPWR